MWIALVPTWLQEWEKENNSESTPWELYWKAESLSQSQRRAVIAIIDELLGEST